MSASSEVTAGLEWLAGSELPLSSQLVAHPQMPAGMDVSTESDVLAESAESEGASSGAFQRAPRRRGLAPSHGGAATRAATSSHADPMRRLGRSRVTAEDARNPTRVRAAAIALLARRDFASGELRRKLAQQGYAEELVAELIEELVAEGVLNDARYVENFVSYHADRGEGPLRIESELQQFNVAADLIQAALDNGPDWKARARDVRTRRFGPEAPDTWPQKARQARFLQYRGFTGDQIRAALGPDFDPDC